LHALAAGDPPNRGDRIFARHVDDRVGAKLAAHLEPALAGAGQDHRLRAERLGDPDPHQPDGPGTGDHHALAGDDPAITSSPYIAVPAVTTSVASASVMSSGMWTIVLTLLTTYSANRHRC